MSNGFGSLIGGGAGGVGAGAAGAGAAAGTSALPWSILIPILMSFLGSIFEKEKDPLEEAMNLKSQMGILGFKPPYQSPYAKGLDPVVLQALMAQLGRTANWGWPGGMGMDTSFIEEALGKIGAGRFGASLPGAIRRR